MRVAPFTAFFHAREASVYFNYAIPDEPVGGDLSVPLARLREQFSTRSRTACFEFLEGFAPALAQSLRAAGFVEELRMPLMVCAPAGLRRPAAVPGLVIEALTETSPIEHVQDSLTIPRRAFGSGNEEPASPEDAEHARVRFGASSKLVGRLLGEPVAVATAVAPLDGLSEVADVAVLTEARGRGIGAAMTAAATEAAFAAGAELVFLTPGETGAMRIYERAGFQPQETMIVAVDSEPFASS